MKILFASDFHGKAVLYEHMTATVEAVRPDLFILGGDMFADGDIDDPLGTQVRYFESEFLPWIESVRPQVTSGQIAAILGNHDWECTAEALRKRNDSGDLIFLDSGQPWTHNGVAFVGFSCTPPTPYWVKDFERLDLPDDETPVTGGVVWSAEEGKGRQCSASEHFRRETCLETELGAVATPDAPWIFVCHAPPNNTVLDILPHVDYPVGSRAIRRFIEMRQPLCALHGHIHESPATTGCYSQKLGETLCINPGQSDDRPHAIWLDTSDPEGTIRHSVFS
jgi:Icc-related predicted phosphoesterase